MTEKKPALLLLPNVLGNVQHHEMFLPISIQKAVLSLDGLIAESDKEGRRFLRRFFSLEDANRIPIALYNEHTSDQDLDFLLEPIRKGERWGLVSDCGLPCVADPGYKLVRRAKQTGIVTQAFVGPSSILLALMLSGLPGQQFSFRGYLAKEPVQRQKMIRELEALSKKEHSTQIFIEAPYRNEHMLNDLLTTLHDKTHLCVAWNLTLQDQGVLSQPIEIWKKSPLPKLEKRATIFLINAI